MKGIFYFCVSTIVLGLLVGCNCDSQPSDKSNAPYRAEVKNENGRPRLYVNGKEMQPIVYGMSDIAAWRTWLPEPQKNIKFFVQEGVKIVLIDSELRHTWKQDGSVDISNIKKDIRGVLDVSPDAPIIVRIHVNAPYWWTLENRDQVVEFGDGPWVDDKKTDDVRLIKNDQPRVMRISLASKKWLKESGEVLERACRELSSTPEGARVIAFQIAGGLQGEWHQWGSVEHEPDFSKPMQERFREYLKQKYHNDATLQKAWGNPAATIAGAKIPPLPERYKTDDGNFRNPVLRADVVDSLETLLLTISEDILYFSKIVKQSWGRPVLCGAFNGYAFDLFGRAPISGHLESKMLFDSPDFDFFCAPFPYSINRKFDGFGLSRNLLDSARIHGKLSLMEMDQHPIGTPMYDDRKPADAPVLPPEYVGGDPKYFPQTIALMRKNMLENYTHGEGAYFYDHRLIFNGSLTRKTGWWCSPALRAEVGNIANIWQTYGAKKFERPSDVAVVLDNPSFYACVPDFLQQNEVVFPFLRALSHSGVVYDTIHSFDLDKIDLPRYKCVIFLNAQRADAAQRKFVREKLQNNGRTLVWIYAAGYSDGKRLGADLTEELTGFKFEKFTDAPLQLRYADAKFPPETPKIKGIVSPILAPTDGTPIAYYGDSQKVAVAKKTFPTHTTYYFGIPPQGKKVVSDIVAESGAHIYCTSGEPIQVGGGILCLTSVNGGKRTINLANGKKVELDIPQCSTTVIDSATGEIILK